MRQLIGYLSVIALVAALCIGLARSVDRVTEPSFGRMLAVLQTTQQDHLLAAAHLERVAASGGYGAWPPNVPTLGLKEIYRYWRTSPEIQAACGPPTGGQKRVSASTFRQVFARCVIHGSVQLTVMPPVPPIGAVPSPTFPAPTPASTPPPLPTPAPTSMPVPPPSATCTDPSSCALWLLVQVNAERAAHGIAPLTFDPALANGSGSCVGAIGHTQDMASTQSIWHADPSYPNASFPADVCGSYVTAGQNVGMAASGSITSDAQSIYNQMEAEPWSPDCTSNHHCNWLNPSYTRMGVAYVQASYGSWPATYEVEEYSG